MSAALRPPLPVRATSRGGARSSELSPRARNVIGLLHRAGSRDIRVIDRARTRSTLLTAFALTLGVVLAVQGPSAAVLAALLATGAGHLGLAGRVDVAKRRLGWVLDAVSDADAVLDRSTVDRLLADAQGDLLTATSNLSIEVQRVTARPIAALHPA